MVLCANIASIVVKYLEPRCLVSFLRDEKIRGRFVYDGSPYILDYDECNVVYGMFPDVVLVGIHFCDLGVSDARGFVMDVRKVVRCRVTCDLESELCMLPKQLDECVGIKVLSLIDYGKIMKICDLSKFVDLHTVNIVTNERDNSQYLRGLEKCKNLKCLRLVNVMLSYNDIEEICKCKKLIHLEISQHINNTLYCDNLCTLILNNFIGCNLNLISCYKIKCIMLINCKTLTDVSKLKQFPDLECVEIIGCDKLKNINVLDECVNLKWVRIEGNCLASMSDKLITLMFDCSNRHHCGHKYKYRRRDL